MKVVKKSLAELSDKKSSSVSLAYQRLHTLLSTLTDFFHLGGQGLDLADMQVQEYLVRNWERREGWGWKGENRRGGSGCDKVIFRGQRWSYKLGIFSLCNLSDMCKANIKCCVTAVVLGVGVMKY